MELLKYLIIMVILEFIVIGLVFNNIFAEYYSPQYAFHIPFLTHNNYNADLDESLDNDDNNNETDLLDNISDY